MNALELPL
jgi:hypothetical protein